MSQNSKDLFPEPPCHGRSRKPRGAGTRAALEAAGLVLASTLVLAWPLAVHGGGSPATGALTDQLQTPGGAGALAGVGDFISSSREAVPTLNLDEPYLYYIEVPAGATALELEIFDADILAGVNDITQDRDQNRDLGGAINTKTRYRLFDPAGNLAAARFNYGDDSFPSSSDNAWLTMFDNTTALASSDDDFTDNFGTNAYNNDDGSQSFAGNWIESNDLGGAGATSGDVQVIGGELRLANQSDAAPFTNQPSVERELDLSTYAAAILTFDWRTDSGVDRIGNTTDIGDSIAVEASSDGGTTYEILDEFAGIVGVDSGTASYDITGYIASNTRIRLRITNRYAGANELFFVDDFSINASTTADGGSPDAGHWTLEVDLSGDVNGRPAGFGGGIFQDDVNAFGLRAHDGTPGSGGTEYNLYADSYVIVGVNNNDRGRDYDYHPYVTSGCDTDVNDFDFDADQPNPPAPNTNTQPFGSLDLTSRSGSFTHSNSTMSNNNAWNSENVTSWVSADTADDYGIWDMEVRIEDWTDNNYGPVYLGSFEAAAAPPTASPEADTFRIYFPTDAGVAPAKPYLSQYLTYVIDLSSGDNPPTVGQTSRYAVSVLVTNPSGSIGDITFSASNVVTAHVPAGAETTYEGVAFVTAGTVVSQPSIGATTGNITWNPGTLSAGESETLVYFVDVSPAAVGDITVTGTAGTGDGTRAVWLDETGAQTFTFGELCELEVITSPATPVLVSSFGATWIDGRTVVEWSTAAEAETVSFDLYRQVGDETRKVSERALPAQIGRSQGGVYRLVDPSAPAAQELTYWLAERETNGRQRFHGPYRVSPKPASTAAELPEGGFESAAHPDPAGGAAVGAVPEGSKLRTTQAGLRGVVGPRWTFGDLVLRVEVQETGLHHISAAELAAALEIPEGAARRLLTRRYLRLETGGEEVAWRKVGRGAGLEFYGSALDTPYSDTNVYRLSVQRGLLMQADRGNLPPADWDGETFRDVSRAEEGRVGVVLMDLDPESDTWFWDYLLPGGEHEEKSFPVGAPARTAGSDAELTLHLQGAAPGDHELEVRMGGAHLGIIDLSDQEARSVTLAVPAGVLADGVNTVDLRSLGGDLVFVDALELTYERHNRPVDGRLLARADGHSTLTAAPFTDPEILVLDVADPLRPKEITALTLPEGGTFRAIWHAEGRGPYLVTDATGRLSPNLAPDAPSSLDDPGHRVDYLLITTADLLGAAAELAEHREGQGLRTMVVDVQDVYDTFRHGVRDPRAVRDFLAFAHGNWASPPRYVVIAGAGHYDYRDYLGYGGNRVPPLLASNGSSLFASDSAFADVNADGLPEMAIGRIPAHSPQQLEAFVNKLITREATGAGAGIDVLSDVPDGDTVFSEVGNQLAALVGAGWEVSHLDLGNLPLADARQQLFASLAEGRGWVHYSGHGGVDRLSNGGLLTSADVPDLDVGGLPPILSSVTCHIGLHALPGFDSLGEHLLGAEGSGAVAVFGPTWLSTHAEAVFLADRLFRQTFLEQPATLGDALLAATRSAAAVGVDASLLGTYQLLGDPAMPVGMEPVPLDGPSDCEPDCSGPG